MRVIGGQARGRRLRAPSGRQLRPTADRVREALFNILAAEIADADFLDLYAGTGAVGIEALSRGARSATFVEREPAHVAVIRANLEACGLEARARVLEDGVGRALGSLASRDARFHLVFLDPPYEDGLERRRSLRKLGQGPLLAPGARIVLETPSRQVPPTGPGLVLTRVARYGEASLAFYEVASTAGASLKSE